MLRVYRRRNRRRGQTGEVEPNQHRWLVSYADFITLLFAFFTTLYAISTVDAHKLADIVVALQAAFDTTSGVQGGSGRSVAPPAAASARPSLPPAFQVPHPKGDGRAAPGLPEAALEQVQQRLAQRLAAAVKSGQVAIELDHRGLVISIREAGSFGVGSSDLPEATRAMFGEIAAPLREVGNFVRIEGHTDDTPIHTPRFASNWELSTARATAVVAYLVDHQGLTPDRLSAAGYSQFHPRAANDSPLNRSHNRRVDIVILNPTTAAAEEPVQRR